MTTVKASSHRAWKKLVCVVGYVPQCRSNGRGTAATYITDIPDDKVDAAIEIAGVTRYTGIERRRKGEMSKADVARFERGFRALIAEVFGDSAREDFRDTSYKVSTKYGIVDVSIWKDSRHPTLFIQFRDADRAAGFGPLNLGNKSLNPFASTKWNHHLATTDPHEALAIFREKLERINK